MLHISNEKAVVTIFQVFKVFLVSFYILQKFLCLIYLFNSPVCYQLNDNFFHRDLCLAKTFYFLFFVHLNSLYKNLNAD